MTSDTGATQNKQPLIIWGASGHAASVADAIDAQGRYSVHGYIDDVQPDKQTFLNRPLFGDRSALPRLLAEGIRHIVIAVGANQARQTLTDKATELGFNLPAIIHPSAVIAPNAVLEPGTVALAGVIVNSEAHIGAGTILNTACSVDHHCHVGPMAHIAPGARLGGNTHVGHATLIGIGSTVSNGIRIGDHVIVGAGAVVVGDLESDVVAYGCPARAVRQRRADESGLQRN